MYSPHNIIAIVYHTVLTEDHTINLQRYPLSIPIILESQKPCLQLIRWLRTAVTFPCHVVQEQKESHYDWKRIQTSEQQALRERKSILHKALVFARRANQLMVEDWVQGLRNSNSDTQNTSFYDVHPIPLFPKRLFNIIQILNLCPWCCTVTVLQESGVYSGDDGFRAAFLRGVDEYNNYGIALSNPQLRVGHEAALELYGFKVAWGKAIRFLFLRIPSSPQECLKYSNVFGVALGLQKWVSSCEFQDSNNCFFHRSSKACQVGVANTVWFLIESHLHQFRWEQSGQGLAKLLFFLPVWN